MGPAREELGLAKDKSDSGFRICVQPVRHVAHGTARLAAIMPSDYSGVPLFAEAAVAVFWALLTFVSQKNRVS